MLGTILWNTGALGAWSPFNLISVSPTLGSLASVRIGAGAAVGIGTHTPAVFNGSQVQAFVGDFYYRFHITTLVLDLGNLISDQTQQVTIWNAYRRAWTLTGLSISNGEGIAVSGQPDPPLQFAPLQERAYSVSILTEGPPRIDARVTWSFSSGTSISLDIVGQRIVLWNWKPDWSAGVLETLRWYTDVIPAGRGEEQRRAMLIDPRQMLEFTSTVTKVDRRIMESILWNWGARAWAVPLWFDGQSLTATLTLGASAIPLSPTGRGFAVGELALLTSPENPQDYEVVEVLSLGGSITLVRPTLKTWVAGTMVYPARTAVIENAAQVSRFDGLTGTLRLQWRMLDPTTWTAAATPTYRGSPVLELIPNWTDDPVVTFDRETTVLDAGVGLTEIIDRTEMPMTAQRMGFTLTSKVQIDTWKKRLWALRGKQVAIWVPTWASDLTVVLDIGNAASTIDVEWLGFTKYLAQDVGRRDIRIEARNGTIYYRRLTGSVEVSPTVERLSIDSSLGADLAIADIMLVSFLSLTRSDSDQHEFSYFQGDVADTVFIARGFRTEQ